MYVRCPADLESLTDPRVFVCGQVMAVDSFKKTVKIRVYDPFGYLQFFEDLPRGEFELPEGMVQHCSFFVGSVVIFNKQPYKVLSCKLENDGFFYYFIQNGKNKDISRVCEKDIIAAFNNGRVDPDEQLKNYEFQNPCWFLGHSIVSKSINVLDNSIYGFKDLAGSRIYLLAHQVNTIMRCLQELPCRYMLADEVGMGKTIEAISIFKIFLHERCNQKVLIVVPEALKAQWETELFFKFYLVPGKDKNNNELTIKTISEISNSDLSEKWDFVIIDEVHRFLVNYYDDIHSISQNSSNILLLSATPVQQRKSEYLSLLRILLPDKYDQFSIEQFSDLVEKQSSIIQKVSLILDSLGDLEEETQDVIEAGGNPHESEDCKDLFEEIREGLEEICDDLDDIKLFDLLEKIQFSDDDLGIYSIKVISSYICSNYQIESNIIRNRRKLLESIENEERLLPKRELETIYYELNTDQNAYETLAYELLSNWIIEKANEGEEAIQNVIRPLLSAFFSSPWAFRAQLHRLPKNDFEKINELISTVNNWCSFENYILKNITEIINDPDKYAEYYSTRMVTTMNAIFDDYFDQKIVIFTNFEETFNAYKSALSNLFPAEEISFFGSGLSKDEIEINAYKFQNDPMCKILLCDSSGGEGRNFQCADYVLHIDLPWDANTIEQRIGRLDRLERDPARPIVHSVVVYTKDTFEDALFEFWNKGLKIFNQSLSGMEIIMNDINMEIISAISKDFKYALFDCIPRIVELAESMRLTVRKEQNFDAAGSVYKPMYNKLHRLIDYYSQNENDLFASTMASWASLAGFHGKSNKDGIITYSGNSFIPKSAINAMLIPPKWNEYIDLAQNAFVNHIQDEYNKERDIKRDSHSIKGTFIRKIAIENDYLHFFSPGDAVFDCIVENAIHSCKGQSSAFAFPSHYNWLGIIYTWTVRPDFDYLLSNGVSTYSLGLYRNYLLSDQVIVPIAIRNDKQISNKLIVSEFTKLTSLGFASNDVVHLGKRGSTWGFLKKYISGISNINWFKKEFPKDNWTELVDSSREESYRHAYDVFKRRSDIRGAQDEMERTLSARAANAEYYGLSDDGIDDLKHTHEVLLHAIENPKLVLDSAAFVWMVKQL